MSLLHSKSRRNVSSQELRKLLWSLGLQSHLIFMDPSERKLILPPTPFSVCCLPSPRSNPRDFPGGLGVKNLPYNSGDMGSTPGQGTRVPPAGEQLSLWDTTRVCEPGKPLVFLPGKSHGQRSLAGCGDLATKQQEWKYLEWSCKLSLR